MAVYPQRVRRNPSRVPHVDPVRRPIHRPAKTLRVHKGFQQHHRRDRTLASQSLARRLWQSDRTRDPKLHTMPVGQNEKAAVVDDQLQAAIALAKVPTDPTIAHRALEGRGGKAQQRYPFLPPGGDVPERLADLRQSPQVVMLPHQFLVTGLIAGTNGPDHDLTQVRTRSRVTVLGTHSRARI